jgi:hypothetical protein
MNYKEKRIKAIVDKAIVEARIDELKRSKTYYTSQTVYRNRLLQLEDKLETLSDFLGEDEESETLKVKLTARVPEDMFRKVRAEGLTGPDFVQYLVKEGLEIS